MDSKKAIRISIISLIILIVGVFIIFLHSFYNSYYTLYGKKLDNMFKEETPKETTNTVPIMSKDELADSFWDSYVNPLNISYSNPKTDSYSIKNDYYTYVDKEYQVGENIVLHYKIPDTAKAENENTYSISDMSMIFKINVEKIEDVTEFENYSYETFLPEYINKRFQRLNGDNIILKELKQVKVFDYYYYEVYTLDYYTTYFVIVQNGYIISLNTRTSVKDYNEPLDKLSEFLSYTYLTSYVEVK